MHSKEVKTLIYFIGIWWITIIVSYFLKEQSSNRKTERTFIDNLDTLEIVLPLDDVNIQSDKKSTPTKTSLLSNETFAPSNYFYDFGTNTPYGLATLFQALKQSQRDEQRMYRIAYYGDSMIEGDILTQDFRKLWQQKFGGSGVGYLPLTSPVQFLQLTAQLRYSDNWKTHSILHKNVDFSQLGIAGLVFKTKISKHTPLSETYWAEWHGSKVNPYYQFFQTVSLWYSSSDTAVISYRFDHDTLQTVALCSNGLPTVFTVKNQQDQHRLFRLETLGQAHLSIYGISLESNSGWFVDNFSLRGAGGWELENLPANILQTLSEQLNYRAVFLQFGANIYNSTTEGYAWYIRKMTPAIDQIKKCFPQSTIILVSNPDRCKKTDGGFESEESVPLFINAQKKCAEKNQIVFWNLYEAMGGRGSAILFQNKRMIAEDHIHFSSQGGRKLAIAFYEALIAEYEKWLQIEATH